MGIISENKKILDLYLKTRDEEYISQILENSSAMIRNVTKSVLLNNGIEEDRVDEYIGIGYYEVLIKLRKMKPYNYNDLSFYYYLSSCVRRGVSRELEKENLFNNNYSFDCDSDIEILDQFYFYDDFIEDENDKIYTEQFVDSVMKCINAYLNEFERGIVCMYYGLTKDEYLYIKDISKKLNISQTRVSDVLEKFRRIYINHSKKYGFKIQTFGR